MASNSDFDRPKDETILPRLGEVATSSSSLGITGASAVKLAAVTSDSHPIQESSGELLEPGWVLCNRYRVVRFIARGGMGEVYEAEDQVLGERVALKTVLPEIAADERAMDRFKREIQLARKVTHTNVCRINDLFHHLPDSRQAGGPPEVTFLTMELLTGRSLADYILAHEKLSVSETVGLAIQIARGLGAAHDAGVIHRDLKSANVMLVSGESGMRAVITDFGLARAAAKSSDQHTLTGSNDIVGTPAYMAPEQIEGGTITPATDIYALGVVMFEMLTGRWPFIAETRLATALKRLTEPPPSPKQFVPDIDPRIEQVVLHCLGREVEARFAKAGDVIQALQGKTVVEQRPAPPLSPPRRMRLAIPAAALCVLMVAAYVANRLIPAGSRSKGSEAPSVIKVRPVAAVLGFKGLSPNSHDAWIATAVSEMLNTELAASEKVRTVPGDEVARVKTELSLSDTDSLAGDKLSLVQGSLAADYLVLGSFLTSGKSGEQLRFDVRLEDGRGETLASFAVSGTTADLPGVGSNIAARLREKLGLMNLDASQRAGVAIMVPANREAARLYSDALASLRAFDAQAASESLQKAAAIEPDQPSIHLALSSAWTLLGFDTRARESAQKAFDLVKAREGLPQQFRFLVEGRYDEASHQWDKAIDVYSSLHRFYPDSLDYGLRLGSAQISGAHGEDALATYGSLKKLPPPWNLDPRIALGEALANGALNRGDMQLRAAQQAAARAEQIHAPLLAAPALLNECIAERKLGQLDPGIANCQRAKEIFSVFGDRIGVAWSTNNIGVIYREKGDLDAARASYEQALAIATSVGARRHMAGALTNIGHIYYQTGDMPHARDYITRSLAVSREIDDRKNQATALNNLAATYDFEADLTHALRTYDEVADLARQGSNRDSLAFATYNQGLAQFQLGDLQQARRNYEEASRLWKELRAKSNIVNVEAAEAELLAAEGDEPAAARLLDDAEAVAKETKSEANVASVQLSRAIVLFTSRRFDEAQAYATKAAEAFSRQKDKDDEGEALIISARALLRLGKDAGPLLVQFAQLGTKYKALQLRAQIATAEAAATAGKTQEARASFRKVADEASRLGLVKIECDARLAAAQIRSAARADRLSEARLVATKARRASLTVLADDATSLLAQLR
jgi:eukaryotic-like serine/threonine-protein kinase